MFLERKIQNLFFLIFIIILVWVTPLYLVEANEAKVVKNSQSCKNIPSFTINSKSNNTKLHLPAKLTFDIFDLDDIQKTKEERRYFYKLTFEDNDLLKELNKEKQALKDKSFVCHLNTSIFDSDNNPLTDLFDIKCSYRKSGTKDSFVEFENLSQSKNFYEIDMDQKRLEKQKERKFSFSKIDLEEWAYDIQIEIKTKKEELYLEKYKKLENDKKKIRLKCELDITDKDNYPVYLFENISKTIKNISKTNCDFDMSKTNYDFDFISSSDVKILSNPIWLVFKKNNEFLIWDLIIKQEVKYKEYKKYQDLMNLYHYSWEKKIENEIDNKFDRDLISLKSEVDENKNINSEITKTILSLNTTISVKEQELNNLKSQLEENILNQQKTKEKYESSDKEYKEFEKNKNQQESYNKTELKRLKSIVDENKNIYQNYKRSKLNKEKYESSNEEYKEFENNKNRQESYNKTELKRLKSIVDENYKIYQNYEKSKINSEVTKKISVKEQELNNLKSQLEENILNQQKTKEKYESSNKEYTEFENNKNQQESYNTIELQRLKSIVDENYKIYQNYNNSKINPEVTKTILLLNTTISVKEQELNNLKSQLEENILNQKETKEKYESSNTKYLEECKKKEDKIKQEFDSNNVSRIKLYFLKEIYDINNSDTHSSLHVKCDWDIGEIKYDGGESDKGFNNYISKTLKGFQLGESIKIEPSEIKETCDRLKNLLKEKLSDEEYHEMMDNLNKENWNIVENTVGKKFVEYLKNNYTSVGNKEILLNKEIKESEQIDKTKKDYIKKLNIMKKAKENAVAMLSPRTQYVPLKIRNKKR